jgi:hypothetical protein
MRCFISLRTDPALPKALGSSSSACEIPARPAAIRYTSRFVNRSSCGCEKASVTWSNKSICVVFMVINPERRPVKPIDRAAKSRRVMRTFYLPPTDAISKKSAFLATFPQRGGRAAPYSLLTSRASGASTWPPPAAVFFRSPSGIHSRWAVLLRTFSRSTGCNTSSLPCSLLIAALVL